MGEWFWVAPIFPLAAVLLIAALPRAWSSLAAGLAIGSVALATASTFVSLAAAAESYSAIVSVPWMVAGAQTFAVALRLDPLSALMAGVVTPVSLAVFLYAARNMKGDPGYARLFALLCLFVALKLTLVLADDIILLFIAWELVGFCSYLLIGFWFERPEVPAAATKAFQVTRIADAALLAGILLLVRIAGSSSVSGILSAVDRGEAKGPMLGAAALLLFIGAMGKSAQVPLHAWLPDAMAGPTPVSALIHSATMVVAGVYLVGRFFPLFETAGILPIIAWVGATSALFGSVAALLQPNLKRLLAYSTMSQIGLMFVGLGAGSLTAGMLLLVGQAFYKSLLFLAAGSVGHEVGSTDFQPMGGLARRMPVTFATFALGSLALAGLPISLAWPVKDAVLAAAWTASPPLFAVALLASFFTALYTARAASLTFLGAARSAAAERAQESPRALLLPKIALAGMLVIAAAAASPFFGEPFGHLLHAPIPEVHTATALALGVAVAGLGAGWAAHWRWPGALVWPPLAPLAPFVERGLGFPALYAGVGKGVATLVGAVRTFDQAVFEPLAPALAAAARSAARAVRSFEASMLEPLGGRIAVRTLAIVRSARRVDVEVFDAATDALTRGVLALVRSSRRFDMRRLDAGFDASGTALVRLGQRLRATQTGRVYNYFLAVFVWGLGVLLVAAAAIIF